MFMSKVDLRIVTMHCFKGNLSQYLLSPLCSQNDTNLGIKTNTKIPIDQHHFILEKTLLPPNQECHERIIAQNAKPSQEKETLERPPLKGKNTGQGEGVPSGTLGPPWHGLQGETMLPAPRGQSLCPAAPPQPAA